MFSSRPHSGTSQTAGTCTRQSGGAPLGLSLEASAPPLRALHTAAQTRRTGCGIQSVHDRTAVIMMGAQRNHTAVRTGMYGTPLRRITLLVSLHTSSGTRPVTPTLPNVLNVNPLRVTAPHNAILPLGKDQAQPAGLTHATVPALFQHPAFWYSRNTNRSPPSGPPPVRCWRQTHVIPLCRSPLAAAPSLTCTPRPLADALPAAVPPRAALPQTLLPLLRRPRIHVPRRRQQHALRVAAGAPHSMGAV